VRSELYKIELLYTCCKVENHVATWEQSQIDGK